MIYSNMNKPSANMLMDQHKLSEMTREQQQEIYAADRDSLIREQAAIAREREEYATQMQNCISEQTKNVHSRAEFLQNVKESFVSECIMKLYCESMVTPMTSQDRTVARNLVNRFVKENGAGDLIVNFSTRNILLSEMARICQKYYDKVLEGLLDPENDPTRPKDTKPGEVKEYNLDTTIKDDFYKELEDVDTLDASKIIKERVADAMQQFVDDNSCAKMDYEEVIQQAQEKIASAKDEAMIEEYSSIAKRKINEMKLNRKKNVFNIMVEALTKRVLTDDTYKVRYMNESTVDMDSVVGSVQLIYTMLEMVNTTNMVNVDEKFITEYLDSLS